MQHTRSQRALAHAHRQWVSLASHYKRDERLAPHVAARLKSRQIIKRDDDILIIEVGFVTMAIHSDFATYVDGLLVVPGADDSGQRGFLVLFGGSAPFHSLAGDVRSASEEALQSQHKARLLADAYGDKEAIYLAARRAPWFMMIREEDLVMSGMCVWGVDSWLRRYGLNRFRRFGLPSIVLRLAGFYGARVTACALLRVNGTYSNGDEVGEVAANSVV